MSVLTDAQATLAALQTARDSRLANGAVKEVYRAGKRMVKENATITEINDRIADLEDEIADLLAAEGTGRRRRHGIRLRYNGR